MALGSGVGERRHTILVCEIGVSTGLKNEPCRLDVAWPTLAEDDDFQEAGPTEVVDVVHVNRRRQQ